MRFGSAIELGGRGAKSREFRAVLRNPENRRQNTPIHIEKIDMTNPEFQLQPNSCLGILAPGATCRIPMVFSPAGAGARAGTLVITDNTTARTHVVLLRGTGVPGRLHYRPKKLSFGRVPARQPSTARSITLSNPNPVTMTLGTISADNPDFALGGTCGATLDPLGSCTIQVTFTPSQKQTESAVITVPDDARGNPHTVKVWGIGR